MGTDSCCAVAILPVMCMQGILPIGGLHERAAIPLGRAEHAPSRKSHLRSHALPAQLLNHIAALRCKTIALSAMSECRCMH